MDFVHSALVARIVQTENLQSLGLFNCGLVFLTALLYYFAEETPFSQMYSLLMSDLPALSTSKLSSWTDHRKV